MKHSTLVKMAKLLEVELAGDAVKSIKRKLPQLRNRSDKFYWGPFMRAFQNKHVQRAWKAKVMFSGL